MENYILEEIKKFAVGKLIAAYGFCGCADGPQMAMLNSDDKNGIDICGNNFSLRWLLARDCNFYPRRDQERSGRHLETNEQSLSRGILRQC